MSEARRPDDRSAALVESWRTRGRRQVHADLEIPIDVTFAYDPADPWAVRVSFAHLGLVIDWTLSRELLRTGIRTSCGLGDVQLWPVRLGGRGGRLRIRLGGTGSPVLVDVDRRAFRAWLATTFEAVPPGTEPDHVDWAAEVRNLGAGS